METAHKNYDNTLADVIWWMKGFAANSANDSVDVRGMQGGLRGLRDWLCKLGTQSRGESYRIIAMDRTTVKIVLTEAEFDQINDGLVGNTDEDRQKAATTMLAIRAQWEAEVARNQDQDAPF